MKLLKILPFLSIIFAVTLTMSAVGALGEPVGVKSEPAVTQKNSEISVIGIANAAANEPILDLDKIEEIINLNRVFDDFVYDTDALIDEAKFVLLDKAETVDGTLAIKRETVDRFVAELYGRKLARKSASEYYTVSDHGYAEITQHIVSAEVNADGSVTVVSCLDCGDICESATVTYSLSPAANRYGYIIRSAEING